ncbi:hypothetical protein FNV43_RR27111 [Rhamnella rubrinervis]|uniref:ADP-ribosyl cyclase/cyclic ADP-ribose hydrolase n=1 Tax=Rhamnella rubrinervis TaxID=2594499 RepID=A0A8K0GPD8_9ROSA|nr:hypothetical protein FNV43_RR27111 [Rhamnella rubrinervis]
MKKMELELGIGQFDVRIIGIWGMPGIGKTTLAREIFKKKSHGFEASAFIDNVREGFEKTNGKLHIQKRLYQSLLNINEGSLHDDHMEINVLWKRMHSRKMLVVLDDVDKLEQIENLIGQSKQQKEWLGAGSRVIVTTRNNHLLRKHGDDNIYTYEVKKLIYNDALELFGKRAFDINRRPFHESCIPNGYKELSVNLVDYADGHPFTLEILGTFLYTKTVSEWSNILAKLKDYPDGDPSHNTLKLSYNGLDEGQKEMFLDIACFFKGEDQYRVKRIFGGCGFYPTIGVNMLKEKCLITIAGDRLWMHDLLQEFGHNIVRQESTNLLGKCSRLWCHEDARNVLENNKGTEAVQGIFHYPPENEKEVHLSIDPFSKMKKLRLLKIHNMFFSECGYLSNELCLLEWHKYPLSYMPSSFQPKKLVELNMTNSCIERLWEETNTVSLEKLILMDLSNCEYLIQTPDFSKISNLERLVLKGCKRLSVVDSTIENLKRLILLDLRDCKDLLSLPNSICGLTSLKTLEISGCSQLDQLPENIGSLEQLVKLDACRTAIRKAPSSIVLLKTLQTLCLAQCSGVPEGSLHISESTSFQLPNSFSGLTSLKSLSLAKCNLPEGAIPEDIGCLSLLERLELSENNFMSLPKSISQLSNLRHFSLNKCSKLQSLPKPPLSVKLLQAHGCPMLNDQMTIWPSDKGFSFIDCRESGEAEGCLEHHNLPMLEEHIDQLFPKFIKDNIFHGGNLEIRFPYKRIPEWCSHWNNGSSITIRPHIQDDSSRTWMGFSLFVVFEIQKQEYFDEGSDLKETCFRFYANEVLLKDPLTIESFNNFKVGSYGLCVFVPQIRFGEQLNKASHFKASFSTNRQDVDVKMCGLHVIFDQDVSKFTRDLGRFARNFPIPFSFPTQHFQFHWFFHHSVGRFIVCYLPKNMFDDKSWVGFSLYVVLEMSPSDLHKIYSCSETPPMLHIDLHSHGNSISHIKSFTNLPIIGYSRQIFLFNAPRVYFRKELNQCWGVSTLFRTSIPDVKIEMCGIRVIYEQDLGDLTNMITECELNTPEDADPQSRYQAYVDLVQYLLCLFESHEPNMRKEKIPIHSREYESPQTNNFLLSTQPVDEQVLSTYENFSVPSDPIAVHSKKFLFESSKQVIEESLRDSAEGLVHLQIMAETGLYENDEYLVKRWKDNLKLWLPFYVSLYYVTITLSIKGRNICLLKPFNPFNTYNLCFPRKEIIDWFANRSVRIELPPNLKTDKNWRGIAVCVAFTVHEHPSAIVDDQDSEISSFRLLCNLIMDQKYYLNPVSMFRINKDKFKWSYLGGFIWLTYIPSCLLVAELDGQKYIDIDIYNDCPGLFMQNLGVRLLYQEDVEEFRNSINKCVISFFDNLDLIREFVANESENRASHADHVHQTETSENRDSQQQENPGKSGPDFSRAMIYNSCFPPKTEVLHWFGHQSDGPSVTMLLLPANQNSSGGNWIGLALYAHFSDLRDPTNCGRQILHNYLTCHMETERNILKPVHQYIEASFESGRQGMRVQKCGLSLLNEHGVKKFDSTIKHCMTLRDRFLKTIPAISNPNDKETTQKCKYATQQEDLIGPTYPGKSGLDFDRDILYDSCFPPTEILEWFSHHNTTGPSVTIQLPSKVYSDDSWIGLALCAYFSEFEHPSTFSDKFDLEAPHYLVCYLETEKVGLQSLHHCEISNDEPKKSYHGEFIWMSYIPRLLFSEQLDHCTLIEASFASDRVGFGANKCGLRLLYRHNEEEFQKTINHCMTTSLMVVDNQESISENVEFVNEGTKKQYNDGQAVGCSKSAGSYTDDREQESMEGPTDLNENDKGKRVLK